MEHFSTARPPSSPQSSHNDCRQSHAVSRIPSDIRSCEGNFGVSTSQFYSPIICAATSRDVLYLHRTNIQYVRYHKFVYQQKRHVLQNILFQGVGSAEFFNLEGFHFYPLEPDFDWDMLKCNVTCGDFSLELDVIEMDSVPCGPEFSVEFVHFVWDNFE